MRVLIAGCGYVGVELGRRLAAGGHDVWGLRRDAGEIPAPIRPLSADLLDPALHRRLPIVDRVVYTAAADAPSQERYRDAYVRGPANLLGALARRGREVSRFLFTSSTAVYGNSGGDWVDESTPVSPDNFRGSEVLEGERMVLSASSDAVVLRLGGIYGPGRTRLVERVRSGEATCAGGDPYWSNRIHRDDAARALQHLLFLERPDSLYIGVDDVPSPICDVLRYLAQLLGVEPPKVDPTTRPGRSNKRCSNRKLRASGFELMFPSYEEGYEAVLESLGRGSAGGMG